MPPRSWRHRLEDILESIEKIQRYTSGMDEAEFSANELVIDAVIRNLEIIGEAATHVPEDVAQRYPALPWAEMRGMRNILAHEYFGADVNTIWSTVQVDLPSLPAQLTQILDENAQ